MFNARNRYLKSEVALSSRPQLAQLKQFIGKRLYISVVTRWRDWCVEITLSPCVEAQTSSWSMATMPEASLTKRRQLLCESRFKWHELGEHLLDYGGRQNRQNLRNRIAPREWHKSDKSRAFSALCGRCRGVSLNNGLETLVKIFFNESGSRRNSDKSDYKILWATMAAVKGFSHPLPFWFVSPEPTEHN